MGSAPAYLARIRYTGSTLPHSETLRNLHRAHLFTVPFENLDIGWKRPIICSMATPSGRITLSDLRLIVTDSGKREEHELTEREWQPALQKYFGVRL